MWSTFCMRLSVVCYLDDESTSIVRSMQNTLGNLTGARASLDLWLPHITVGDGVEVNESELSILKDRFEFLAVNTKPFNLDLYEILKIDFRKGGEGEATTPYGLYLDVKQNEELLKFVSSIAAVSEPLKKWYLMPSPYHPHCALAFKDLSEEGYKLGSKYLDKQNIKLRTKISSVSIVEMLPNATREFARFNFV